MMLLYASFLLSAALISVIFFATPAMFLFLYLFRKDTTVNYSLSYPRVSLIIVVRNAEHSIEDKIRNAFALTYPPDKFEVIVYSDGSVDGTVEKALSLSLSNLLVLSDQNHEGKNHGLNRAVSKCSGELIAFTDADVLLPPDALVTLVRYFGDPSIGGVCGNKTITRDLSQLSGPQRLYNWYAENLKRLENRIGSIASNDGTLYVIRKNLYRNIPPAVTDDLFVCLSIVKEHYRFLFEPRARAYLTAPSRNPIHEIARRRRIVSSSLRCIFMMKGLLNPLRHGLFSLSLFVNKILRRSLPVLLLMMFFSSLSLWPEHQLIGVFLILQTLFYLAGASYFLLRKVISGKNMITRMASFAFYFCIGNYGTLLGVYDYLRGRQIVKWETT